MKRTIALMTLGFALLATTARAQDMLRDLDLTSPAMVSAEMSRQEVEAMLANASAGTPADFTGKRLSGLDLSGASLVGATIADAHLGADMRNQSMGLMRAVLRSANLAQLNARNADLSRVDLEFASLKGADLSGASLRNAQLGGADLTGATVIDTDFDGADLTSARLIAPIGLDRAKNFDKAKNRERLIRQ